ncbi:MAG: glutathione S-transferase family protein [Solirubrobacteraceae bacterium]|nr:glutathione S-transferase family protein [Solirubrobacteraceae bacterium]
MAPRLYLIHGSHPCTTVELALQRKGMDYRVVELLPPMHAAVTRVLFGERTVPAITFGGGDRVSGSRAILRRLDELQPDPPLLPTDPQARQRALDAEQWGDEVFQGAARRLLWPALEQQKSALPSYQRGSRYPSLPAPVIQAVAPAILAAEMRLSATNWGEAQAGLRALPGQLDHIDHLLADGVLSAEEPTAADFQIAPSVRLLMTIGDLRPLIEGRPLAAWARAVAPEPPGAIAPGVFEIAS